MTLVITIRVFSSVYSYWLLFIKLTYSEDSFFYTVLQYELYQNSGKGNVIADSAITTTPIAFILTRYRLFSMFYRSTSRIDNLLGKKNIEDAFMSKSCNIAFSYLQ